MRLNVADREYLRKRDKILIPQMKKSEIVKHLRMKHSVAEFKKNGPKLIKIDPEHI